jgi:hypothetical protein
MAKSGEEAKKETGFQLPRKGIIKVMPIPRGSAMIKDPNHVGYFMYPNTEATYTLPRYASNNTWVKCLTDEEIEFLEKELKEDLSFRKDNPYWTKRKVKIKRTDALLANGFSIDISNADGYLDYKVLSVQPTICDGWEKRNDTPEYRFALVTEGEIMNSEIDSADIEQECFEHFTKIKNSHKQLMNFLLMFGNKADKTHTVDFLRTEAWKIMKNSPKKYKKVIDDPNYETKVFINDCMTAGALKLQGRTTYTLGYGSEDVIGRTLLDTVLYLKDKKNSATILELEARIEKVTT